MKKLRPFQWLGGLLSKVFARYEGAIHQWGTRSYLPASVQDARFDIDRATRWELLRRARYWEKNSGIVNRLVDVFEQYTTGANGLQVIPASKDEAWNQKASDWWNGWCQVPDLVSLQSFGVLQSLMSRAWFVDGELLIYKTYSPDTDRPRIQLIESHRCETPWDLRKEEGKNVIDGVKVNPAGRPIAYYLRDRQDDASFEGFGRQQMAGTFNPVDAGNIIHLFEPCRPSQYRGISFLYPVLNDLHDLEDLQMLEQKAAKSAARVANIVINQSGEPGNRAQIIRQKLQMQSKDAAGNNITKEAGQFYEYTVGGDTVFLKPGEDMKQFASNRPSVTTIDYWNYLVAKICAGVGISRLLVMPYSMQGTVTRADLDVANAFFRARSAVMATVVRQIYNWAIGWAVKNDRTMMGAPADWYACTVRAPRAVNVDVGRNSSAMLDELEAGTRTFQDIYAETGEDWRAQLRQKAAERAFIHGLVDEFAAKGITLSPDEIAGLSKPPAVKEPEGDEGKMNAENRLQGFIG